MQCDTKVYRKCAKRACRNCGLKIRTGSSARVIQRVCGAVSLIVLSVFSDRFPSMLCPEVSSSMVVVGDIVDEVAPVSSEGRPMAPLARRGYSSDLGVSHACGDPPACPIFLFVYVL